MRIWLGTWNVEQQFPSLQQLQDLVNDANGSPFAAATCDVIVMCFQECARQHAVPTIGGHVAILHQTAMGQTKNQENCQALMAWEMARGVNGTINHIGGGGVNSVTERTFKRKVKFWAEYGKGSASNILWFHPNGAAAPWGIVISAAHLDSKSAAKRTVQVNNAVNAAPTVAHGAGNWDVQFLLGDLNFRLDKTANHNLAAFSTLVATNRRMLFGDDSMRNDPVLGPAGNWTFPDPVQGVPGPAAPLQLPTYKRIYKPAAAAVVARNVAGLLATNPAANAQRVPQLFDLKTDSNGAVAEGGRDGQYDMGWLDRIGYRVRAGSGRTVTHVYSGSPAQLVLSDHAPVYSVFDIT